MGLAERSPFINKKSLKSPTHPQGGADREVFSGDELLFINERSEVVFAAG
jgi:hypothetical protein